ncbi:MAG: hypothetical protein U0T33_09490 [Bacteroidales bacterium]
MKNLIFGFLLALSSQTTFGQNNATIDETIDFIKSKLSKDNSWSEGSFKQTVTFRKAEHMLIIRKIQTGSIPFDESIFVPLNKMDPSGIEIFENKNDKNRIRMNVYTINKERVIKTVFADNQYKPEFDNYTQFIFDPIDIQNNIPERFKKAFIHAIGLSGGQQEKF